MFRVKSENGKYILEVPDNFMGEATLMVPDPSGIVVKETEIKFPCDILLTFMEVGSEAAGRAIIKDVDTLRDALIGGAKDLNEFAQKMMNLGDNLNNAKNVALGSQVQIIRCVCGQEHETPIITGTVCWGCGRVYEGEPGRRRWVEVKVCATEKSSRSGRSFISRLLFWRRTP